MARWQGLRTTIPPCPTVDQKSRSLHSRDRPQGNPITLENVRAYSRFPQETQACHGPFWTTAIMICPNRDSQSNSSKLLEAAHSSHPSGKPAFLCAVCSYPPCHSGTHTFGRRLSCHMRPPPWSFIADDTRRYSRTGPRFYLDNRLDIVRCRTTRSARSRPLRNGGWVLSSVYIGGQLV